MSFWVRQLSSEPLLGKPVLPLVRRAMSSRRQWEKFLVQPGSAQYEFLLQTQWIQKFLASELVRGNGRTTLAYIGHWLGCRRGPFRGCMNMDFLTFSPYFMIQFQANPCDEDNCGLVGQVVALFPCFAGILRCFGLLEQNSPFVLFDSQKTLLYTSKTLLLTRKIR